MVTDNLHVDMNCEADLVSWAACYGTDCCPGFNVCSKTEDWMPIFSQISYIAFAGNYFLSRTFWDTWIWAAFSLLQFGKGKWVWCFFAEGWAVPVFPTFWPSDNIQFWEEWSACGSCACAVVENIDGEFFCSFVWITLPIKPVWYKLVDVVKIAQDC